MGKSKVPFKTNVDTPIRKSSSSPQSKPAQTRQSKDGYWLRRRDRPLKAVVVNQEKERNRLARWLLMWVVIIPCSFIALMWLILLFFDLFTA